ncbi:hypothetical protein ROE7235_02446 [Roseibaca ekhonensis]|uniref:Uncharacterized protein n=1 Tax=Roseinatronobacter ekhonensis TaxID=254356 RepID=A0A3B0M9S8_9RHOB|nr:hypothetical protein [Roseibaca ekhonensis]SUZ32685.1 hypothetical protein ROE7235_02446 [Roseibaca ekhonensis]
MELKDFIKSTMQSIIDATAELIEENTEKKAHINPLTYSANSVDFVRYSDGFVQMTTVSFDVAITKGSEKEGNGKVGVDVYVAKIGSDGTIRASDENVSRVQFALRAALPATKGPSERERYDGSFFSG